MKTFEDWFNGSWEQDKHSCDYSWSKEAWQASQRATAERILAIISQTPFHSCDLHMAIERIKEEFLDGNN